MLYRFQVVTNVYFPKDTEAPSGGVDDMTKLSYLHEPGVLQNLETRYELNEIYVRYFTFFSSISYFLLLQSKSFEKSYDTNKFCVTSVDIYGEYPNCS